MAATDREVRRACVDPLVGHFTKPVGQNPSLATHPSDSPKKIRCAGSIAAQYKFLTMDTYYKRLVRKKHIASFVLSSQCYVMFAFRRTFFVDSDDHTIPYTWWCHSLFLPFFFSRPRSSHRPSASNLLGGWDRARQAGWQVLSRTHTHSLQATTTTTAPSASVRRHHYSFNNLGHFSRPQTASSVRPSVRRRRFYVALPPLDFFTP